MSKRPIKMGLTTILPVTDLMGFLTRETGMSEAEIRGHIEKAKQAGFLSETPDGRLEATIPRTPDKTN